MSLQVLPGTPDYVDSDKVIVPTKYKDDELEGGSSFSRKDNLRASFKEQAAKRFNKSATNNINSVLAKLQAQTASKHTSPLTKLQAQTASKHTSPLTKLQAQTASKHLSPLAAHAERGTCRAVSLLGVLWQYDVFSFLITSRTGSLTVSVSVEDGLKRLKLILGSA